MLYSSFKERKSNIHIPDNKFEVYIELIQLLEGLKESKLDYTINEFLVDYLNGEYDKEIAKLRHCTKRINKN